MSSQHDSIDLNQWTTQSLQPENQYPATFQGSLSITDQGTPLEIIGTNAVLSPSGVDCATNHFQSVLPPHPPSTFSTSTYEHLSSNGYCDQQITVSYTISPPPPQSRILGSQFGHSVGYAMHNAQYQSPYETSSSPVVSFWSPPIIQRPSDSYNPATGSHFSQTLGFPNGLRTPYISDAAAAGAWLPGSHMDSSYSRDRNTSVESYGGNFSSPCRKYRSVRVMLLHWQEDGNLPGCTNEVRQLEALFRENLGYRTTTFGIPERNSMAETMGWITRFFHRSRSDELLIVFYAGHATKEPFHLTSSPGSNITISWDPIQELIESSESDVLLLIDSCYAMNSIPCRSAKILIGACGSDQRAAIPGQFSFTTRLLEALRTLSNNFQNGLSATALYIYISSMMKQLPNPWFAQDSQIRLFGGTGDIWIERISNGLNLSLDYYPARNSRRPRRGQDRYRGRKRRH